MEFMAGESHYWPQCYRSACKLHVVCVCVWGGSWMATPDSERNAGFIPVYRPLLAVPALKAIKTNTGNSPPTPQSLCPSA